jgi:NitT/TauT family transport system ATP-binding protein
MTRQLSTAGARGATQMNKISMRGITHYYADEQAKQDHSTIAVDDVWMDLAAGEFVSIIGPSGCGKTTLLNLLAGFLPASQGELRIDGDEVTGVRGKRVSFMFARDTLFPWRTTLANVCFPMEVGGKERRKRSKTEIRARATSLLERVGLADAAGKYPTELSQGMRQRASLARTLASDSDIILMDEPFGALDAQTRVLVQDEFSHIWEEDRPTVLMVTHDLTEAIALSDRIVVMTQRPARIKSVYTVGIQRPRVVLDLPRFDEFHELYSALWSDLRPEIISRDTDHPAVDSRGSS